MNTKAIFYIIIVPIFFATSCKNKSNLELSLLDKDKKWVYINQEKFELNSINHGFYIEFKDNGTCRNCSIIDDSPPIDIHGGSSNGTWDFVKKDNSLIVFGHEFKVLKIQNDTISLLRKEDNWKALFVNHSSKIDSFRNVKR